MHNLLYFAINVINAFREGDPPKGEFYSKRIDGMLDRMDAIANQYEHFHKLAEQRSKIFGIGEITIIAEDLAIVEITRKGEFFGYSPIVNDRISSAYSRNKEIAILIALSEKHEGLNGQFSHYAAKMLDISEPE